MTDRTFTTPDPISLFVELRSGDLVVRAADTAETTVSVTGRDADDVTVEQRGKEIDVVAIPRRRGFFGGDTHEVAVRVTMPLDSRMSTKLGSADLRVHGRLAEAMLRTGSGQIVLDELGADATVEAGSGDVRIGTAHAALRVKCGSGDLTVDRLVGAGEIATGSGDVVVRETSEPVSVRSGSGSMRVHEARADVALDTASGDLVVGLIHRGQLQAKNVSGDITVGVPAGIPVWTDVSSLTGQVRSDLRGAGQPARDQDFLELHARTVSGDVLLQQR